MNFLAKPAAVLFATDIAARGLDFPEVDWVVQVYMGNHNHID
jgi:ATP-dependent RNA helicase DDX10/DBP4